jgi:hypothetical protein
VEEQERIAPVAMKGRCPTLESGIAKTKKGTSTEVPFSVFIWCAQDDESGHWIEVVFVA